MSKIGKTLFILAAIFTIASNGWAVTINVPADQPTIAAAVGVASAGDLIQVAASHSETVLSTINLNVPGLQIVAASGATANLGATATMFLITGSGTTIDGLTITSAVPYAANFVQIGASNVTIQNCVIYGPPQPLPMSSWVVNRAFVTQGGITNFLFTNNTVHTLRQCGYLSGDVVNRGTLSNNTIYNTKGGYVLEYSSWTITGNLWGNIANANEWDIVVLSGTDPALYPDAVALSNANNGGTVWDQRAPSLKTPVYVDASAAPGGIGSPRLPYQSIQDGVTNAYPGGTVYVADGVYNTTLDIYKSLSLVGESESGVVINASASTDYGIDASGDFDFVFQNFTVDGPDGNVSGRYGLKVFGDNATVNISGVTVYGSGRSGIDLNGLASGTVSNVNSYNNGGVGLAMTDCDDITISDLTTYGNAWGGASVMTYGRYATGGSDGVVFSPPLSLTDNIPFYTELNTWNLITPPITNLTMPTGFTNIAGTPLKANWTGYFYSQTNAIAAAIAFGPTGWVKSLSTGHYIVATGMTIQAAIDAASNSDYVDVLAGTYDEDVNINKVLTVTGAGIDVSTIRGLKSGLNSATVRMSAIGAILQGFTVTRDGNNVTDWPTNVKTAGLAVQSTGGAIIRNNKFTGNRTGIDINNANDNQVLNNIIDFNRTGMIFRNSCLNNIVEENMITNNWTVGALWLDSNPGPVNFATGTDFLNNNISGNWYTQVENRDVTSLDVRDFSGNWLGTNTPTTASGNGSEPGYSAQIPVEFGGTATNPGGAVSLRGNGLAAIDYTPWLNSGSDTNVETALGRGTVGFQGNYSNLWADDIAAQTSGVVQEAVDMVSGSTINLLPGTYVGQVHAANFANLNIIGSGTANTFIKAPATAMTDYYTTAANNFPVLFLDNSTVSVSALTVDGDGKGNVNYRFQGIAFWNSSGSLNNVNVVGVRDTPFSGTQHGVGVYAFNNTAGPYTVNLTNVQVTDYQKGGIVLNGNNNLTVTLSNCAVNGVGWTPVTAQNGIQLWGSAGTLTNSSATGNAYDGAGWAAGGILLIESAGITLTNCTASGNQVGVYGSDASFALNGGTFTGPGAPSAPRYTAGIAAGNDYSGLANTRPSVQRLGDAPMGSGMNPLDAVGDDSVFVSNATITGINGNTGYGVDAFSWVDNFKATIDGNTIAGWEYGVSVDQVGGTISSATVTDNKLTNTNNTYDEVSGHTWDSNCYSDFGLNGGFPSQYNVAGGGGNIDLNPNLNNCANIDFVTSSTYIGCEAGCVGDTLYLTFDQVGFISGQIFVQLPAGLDANWPVDGSFPGAAHSVYPVVNGATNLLAMATQGRRYNNSGLIEVNMAWAPPYSTGNATQYIACIPFKNVSAVDDQNLTISATTSLFYDINGPYTNAFMFGSATVIVDCEDPGASIAYTAAQACAAYNSAASIENLFTINVTAGVPTNSQLASAYVRVNGNPLQQVMLFNTLQVGNYVNTSFPNTSDAATIWPWLTIEGCNTLEVVATDAECNEYISASVSLAKDTQAPAPAVAYTQSACYNNISGDPQYGATLLVGDLEIDLAAAGLCEASGFDLTLTIGSQVVNAYVDVASIADFPSAGEATTLWNAIVAAVGMTYSGSVTVNWTASDCAGNSAANSFVIPCVDFAAPVNTVTTFDARPADAGVWLNWAWTPDASQAVEMRIYRSPISGGYPAYNPPLRDSYDVTLAAFSGWTLVETQLYGTGQISSATEVDANNRGDFHTHGTYWLDAQTGWIAGPQVIDPSPSGPDVPVWRDIYRYVTFVKDAAGNWSTGYTPTPGTNVDHATNYWLGDFAPADAGGTNNSRGQVNTEDLSVLSSAYFTTIGGFRNIGPVILENGFLGKSIPNPETTGEINFFDLVPFSFNYGTVSVYNNPQEFMIQPDPALYRPFTRLDGMPTVTIGMDSEIELAAGTEFTVTVSLNGNEGNAVKAVEAILNFDETMLDFVSASVGNVAAPEGTMFSKASLIEGAGGQVGFAAASCGGWSTLEGSATLGTVTFRVKSDELATCEISLSSVKLLDNTGEVVEPEGNVITVLGAAIPDNYALYQNYPNPFNPTTNIQFDLKESGQVKIMVFNTLGQVVAIVANNHLEAGRHTVSFDASNLASGLYLYSINVNGFSDLKKMVLIR